MQKTILHITDNLSVGGTEILLKNTLPLIPDCRHIVVYLNKPNDLEGEFSNYPVYCLHHTGNSKVLRSAARLRKLIRKYNVHIIHAHLFWSSIIARIAKTKNVKLITSLHSVLSKDAFEKNHKSLWLERLTSYRQDLVIGVSSFVLKDYIRHVGYKGKSRVLYNFTPHKIVPIQPGFESPIRCIAVGNLKTVKNYSFILSAFSRLPKEKFTLDIAGEGGLRQGLEETISLNHLPVTLLGNVGNVTKLMSNYSIFIQASIYEGFGIALAEGILAGLIPVISDIPVHQEITDGKAYFFQLDDPERLADRLLEIATKPPTILDLDSCRKHVESITSVETYRRELREIYELNSI